MDTRKETQQSVQTRIEERSEALGIALQARLNALGPDYKPPLVRSINYAIESAMTPEEVALMYYPSPP